MLLRKTYQNLLSELVIKFWLILICLLLVQNQIIAQLDLLKFIISKSEGKIEVRYYDASPRISLYEIDDIGFLGIFWREKNVIETTQFRIHGRDQGLARYVNQEFNYLWDRSIEFNNIYENFKNVNKKTNS